MESCSDTCWCRSPGLATDLYEAVGAQHISEEEYLSRLEKIFMQKPDQCRNCGIDNPVHDVVESNARLFRTRFGKVGGQ